MDAAGAHQVKTIDLYFRQQIGLVLEEVKIDFAGVQTFVGVGISVIGDQIDDDSLFREFGRDEFDQFGMGNQIGDSLEGNGFRGFSNGI